MMERKQWSRRDKALQRKEKGAIKEEKKILSHK